MPRPNPGPHLALYGPDTRFGAKQRASFKRFVWYIVWRENGQKREQSTGVERIDGSAEERRAADRALEDFLVDRRLNDRRSPTGPRSAHDFPIAEALVAYAAEHGPKVADPERLGYAIKPLARYWGDQPVSAIRTLTCDAYAVFRAKEFGLAEADRIKAQLAKGHTPKPARELSPATARRELGVLQAALNHCTKAGYVFNAPPVSLPDKSEPRERWLTRTEVAKLLREARKVKRAHSYLPLFILLGVYLGARREAIAGLQWIPNTDGGFVDLDRGVIDFRKRATAKPDRAGKQTKKRRTQVPIPHRLVRFLESARKKNSRFIIGHGETRLANPNRGLAVAAEAAGLGHITSHVLRHTAVTWLMRDGVPPWQVAGWVGMSEQMIDRVYGHHDPSQFELIKQAHR